MAQPHSTAMNHGSHEAQITPLITVGLYLVAVALLAQGVAHSLTIGGIEAPIWTVRWRFGFIGVMFLGVQFPLLGLALGALTASLTRNRGMLRVVITFQAVVLTTLGFSLILFLLDAIQIAATVPPPLRGQYTVTVAQTSLIGGLAIALVVVLLWATYRSFSLAPGSTHKARDERPLVVSRN